MTTISSRYINGMDRPVHRTRLQQLWYGKSKAMLFRNCTEYVIFFQFKTSSKDVTKVNIEATIGPKGLSVGGGNERGDQRQPNPTYFWIPPRQAAHRSSEGASSERHDIIYTDSHVTRDIVDEMIEVQIGYYLFHWEDYVKIKHKRINNYADIISLGSPEFKDQIVNLRTLTEYQIVGPKIPAPKKIYVDDEEKTDAENAEEKEKLADAWTLQWEMMGDWVNRQRERWRI
jgi:hypothetical protein